MPYQVRGGERFFHRPEVRRAMIVRPHRGRPVDAPARRRGTRGAGPGRAHPRPARRRRAAGPVGVAARDRRAGRGAGWRSSPTADLRRFAAELETRADAAHPPTVQGVTLASLHAAKGLEWDVVFLVGLVDGTLPIQHADGDDEAIEEERRLLYVGITRARRRLAAVVGALPPAGRAAPASAQPVPLRADSRRAPRFARGERRRRTRRAQAALPGLRFAADRGRRDEAAPMRRLPVRCGRRAARPAAQLARRTRPASSRSRPMWSSPTPRSPRSPSTGPPTTLRWCGIPGIGARKLDRYGAAVLGLVADVG